MFLIFKMLEKEVLDKVSCLPVVFRIHRHLTEEILHVRTLYRKGSKTVPEIVKSEKCLCACLAALVFRRNETSAQLNGVRKILVDEFL